MPAARRGRRARAGRAARLLSGAVLLAALLATGLGACASNGAPSSASPDSTAPVSGAGSGGVAARPSSGCRVRAHGAAPEAAGQHTLVVAGAPRTYQLDTPATARGSAIPHPAPLILLFHGFAEDGPAMARYTGLPALGARAGDVVASPTGTDQTWQFSATGSDAAFVSALLSHLEAARCIDLARVYLSGFSAGAAFTLIYTCHHQDAIAAVATVAVDFQLGCTRPLPIVAFHGTLDPAVPFANGAKGASLPGVAVRGTELNMGDWAALDRCSPTPTDTVLGTEVTRQQWPGCAAGTAVVLYRIEGGGHTWPGATTDNHAGLTTHQIQADQIILDFFAHHPATAP